MTGLMNKGNKLKTNLKYREVKQAAEVYTVSAVSLFFVVILSWRQPDAPVVVSL